MGIVNLGVDFGGTGLRAAFGPAGGPVEFAEADRPWLLCEPASGTGLPYAFPSLKSRLGAEESSPLGGDRADLQETVAQALGELRERSLAADGARPGRTVVTVPARFPSRQRDALMGAAERAGLGEVALIGDSIAVVMGHADETVTGTYLVYGMGYTGHELGLVRAVRGRYRALGYEGAPSPGGQDLDRAVLQSVLAELSRHGRLPGDLLGGATALLKLRRVAERLKERADSGDPGVFLSDIGRPGQAVFCDRDAFAVTVRELVGSTFERVETVLREAEVKPEAVTALLLSGGTTRSSAMSALAAETGLRTVATDRRAAQLGALRCAHQLATRAASVTDEPPSVPAEALPVVVERPPALSTTLLTSPDAPSEAVDAVSGVEAARALFDRGRLDESEAAAKALRDAADRLLEDIATARGGRKAVSEVERIRAMARRAFKQGEYQQAINLMHRAWARDRRSEVFEEMIQVHCDAAMARPTVADFERQEGWLKCAYHHDSGDAAGSSRILDLLAERSYLHGRELIRLRRRGEAWEVLRNALRWNPDHREARALFDRLKQPPSR